MFFFFALSFLLRLPGLASDAPQTDEITWVKRSAVIVRKIKSGEIHEFSSHLGHPGVVPALVMAAGQVAENSSV